MAAVLIVFVMVSTAFVAMTARAEDVPPAIWTGMDEYSPGDVVNIYGEGFAKWVPVNIVIEHPDLEPKTFVVTPDLYGRFVCNDYVAEELSYNPQLPVNVTATQTVDGMELVAFTQFMDPAAYIEGWTLRPHAKFTTGDVKGYLEGDSVPMIVVLNKRQLGYPDEVTVAIGVDFIDTTPLHIPTYGIDFLTQYWDPTPSPPFNTYTNSSMPFFVDPSQGTITSQQRLPNIYDEGKHLTVQVWEFTMSFAAGARSAVVRYGAHLAITDLLAEKPGASYYPGESLHVRIVELTPPKDEGNRDVPISLDQVTCQPEMDLEKIGDPYYVSEGDIITFTVHFSNAGGCVATCVNLWDILEPAAEIIPGTFLYWDDSNPVPMTPIPGPTLTASGWTWYVGWFPAAISPSDPFDAYLSFQAEVVTNVPGIYYNDVWMDYSDLNNGDYPTLWDDAPFEILGPPEIDIEKSGPWYAHIGDVITYTYVVTNTGSVDLWYVYLVDDHAGYAYIGFLASGDSTTVTLDYTVQAADAHWLYNVVDVYGWDWWGRSAWDWDDWEVEILTPMIDITKDVDPECAKPGETVWYTIYVLNPAESMTTLYDVVVSDPMLGSWNVGTLLAGQSWSDVVPYVLPGSTEWIDILVNTATATGEDLLGMQVSDSDSAAVDVLHPAIIVDKWEQHGWTCAAEGDTLVYWVEVSNPSWDTVMYADVYDTMFGWIWSGYLGAGDSTLLGPFSYTVGAYEPDPLTNYVWANAWDYQQHYAYDEDSWSVDILHPDIEVDKWEAHGWECAAEGDVLEYWIEVSNPTTDTDMYAEVYDTMFGWVWSGWLAAGASYLIGPLYYTVGPNEADPLINEVRVNARDTQDHPATAWDMWYIDIYHPMIEILKYEVNGWECAAAGDALWYVIEVWNPSDDTPMYVKVYDPMFSPFPLLEGVLQPGDWVPITGLWYMVDETTPDPLVNTAWVWAEDPQGHTVYAESSWWVDILHPNIWLDKWEARGWQCAAPGDTLEYWIEVGVNDGDTNMYAQVYDWMLGGLLFEGWIAEGTSVLLGPYYVDVTWDTEDPLVNWAYVYAWDPQDHFAYAEDTWYVDILHPLIYLYKWSPMSCAHDGETIEYYFYIENPSWDTDMYVELYDPLLSGGALWTGTIWAMDNLNLGPFYYTVPVGSEWIDNTAYVLAWDYQGHKVTSESSWQYEILHPQIDVEKEGPTYAAPGDLITYFVNVTNIGDTDLLNVEVDDSLVGWIASISTLTIGQTVMLSYTYTVPAGEGDLVNVVHAWGRDRQDRMAEDRDSWIVTKLVKIWGYKGADLNRDGVFSFGEPGLVNWVIVLSGTTIDGEPVLETRLTDTFGYYEFTNLKPGTYTVSETMQLGWNAYSAVSYDLVLSSGMVAEDVNFMNLPEGSICGYKWHDLNADGDWDLGEPAIEGWTIYVWGFDVNGDEVYLFDITDQDGRYCFPDMIPGAYWVYEETRDGWVPTTLQTVPVDVSLLDPFAVEVWFGNVHLGSISGYKWLDLDMDGVRDDPIEPMLPGWTIILTGFLLDGTPVGPIVDITDEFGYYSFEGLLPGTYTVTEVVPDGWTNITPDSFEFDLGPGDDITCGKFGNLEWASICGWKFLDWDMDGAKDGPEPGLEGWAFTLTGYLDNGIDIGGLDPWDTPIDPVTVLTDEWGVWCFTNLYPGFYWVTEESRPGWYATTPSVQDFEITSGSHVREVKFGNVPYTCLWGYKFEDQNGDGYWDLNEPGVPGWTIVVEGWQNDGVYIHLELTTDDWGYWATCYNILPGAYWIYERSQEGWMVTLPLLGVYYFEIPCVAGPADYWFLFGNFKLGKIFGYKYEDVNGNGLYDEGIDKPVQNWMIYLDLPWGGTVYTMTNENGYWEFTGLPAGWYYVYEETGYAGWTPTAPTGYWVDMLSGGVHGPIVFLNVRYSMVYGWKWNDYDSDGIWDIGEPGIEGWHIYMIWDAEPTIREDVTDENGYYEFNSLLPDANCVIWEEVRAGWTPTTATSYNFGIESGDALNFNFGNFQNVWIEVFKFNDIYGDGWYDPSWYDYGLEGWTFELYKEVWDEDLGMFVLILVDTQVTDEWGYAWFEITEAGWFLIVEVAQDGWCPTTVTSQWVYIESGYVWPTSYFEFGNFKCVDITLFKYEDVDSDGRYTEGVDEPIEGWIIWTYDYASGDLVEYTTDANGLVSLHYCDYAFLEIWENLPEGWRVVTPEWGYYNVEIVSGAAYDWTWGFPVERYFYEFGNFECVDVTVFKFWDTCSNGWYDPDLGDVPIEGWLIVVYDESLDLVTWGYTDEYGYFNFTLCEAGTYYVYEEYRDGWVWIKPETGLYVIEVDSGDDVYLEFANYEIVEVPIFKYEDKNSNGVYDNDDVPIEDWYFELVRYGDGLTYSGYTDVNGLLVLEVSRSGIYTLTEEDRVDWTHINPASGQMLITITSGVEIPLLMFGNYHCVDIWVFKFADVFADGWYDPWDGDVPVEGWMFQLWMETPNGWVLVDTQYTDASGYAQFHVCVAGHYEVVEEWRDGWWWILPYNGYYDIQIESGSQLPIFVFANFKMGMIFGHKWNDVNGNGEYDVGIDTPLAGWHIQFQSLWFGMYGETWTNDDGYYEFTGLPPGYYVVWEESPEAGWIATSDDSVYVYVWGNSRNEVNFLNFKEGCIEGYKWDDLDGDGIYDADQERPIMGWEINLYITGTGGTPEFPTSFIAWIATAYTDENGHYQFCHLGPGTYVVEEEQYDGWEPTTPESVTLDLTSGGKPRVDFLNFHEGIIIGWKWNDLNGNGIWEDGEPGIEGWTINMIRDANPTIYTAVTDANGFWYFEDLWHDYYVIWEEERDGWCPTTPTDALVWIWSGTVAVVDPFGNFQCVDIPVFKYEDVNGDGIYQEGYDMPIEGWVFYLYDETGMLVDSGVTDADGNLVFEVCKGGWFTVVEADVQGWIHTTPVYVQSGYRLRTMMFGNYELGVIYGWKFNDWSLNGIWNLDEPGIVGWTVTLWVWDDLLGWVPVTTKLTGTNGYYEFTGLEAGLYAVTEEVRPGWVPQLPTYAEVPILSGSSEVVMFANALYGWIYGYKFYDKDLDAVMDGDEPGLEDWTIVLEGSTAQGVYVYLTYETESDGWYSFMVQPGVYTITEILPSGEWYATTVLPVEVDVNDAIDPFYVQLDIGNIRYACIYGWKFLDTYAKSYPFWPNGMFDVDEYGLGNWKITLQGWTDTGVWVNLVQYTENEDGNIGYYEFCNLLPGIYWVNETLQYGYYATRPIANLVMVYPFPWGPVTQRIDFGNLLPSRDPEVRFVLTKGWNLWSSPLAITGGLTASQLATAIGSSVAKISKLDTATGQYTTFIPGFNQPGSANDFVIELGKGYFVVTKSETSFVLKGEFAVKTTAALYSGWNIVGYTSMKPTTASQLVTLVSGAKVLRISYLDQDTGQYKSFIPGFNKPGSTYDFTITQGRAYFLVTAGAATLNISV